MAFSFLSKLSCFSGSGATGSCSAPCSRRRTSRVAVAQQAEGSSACQMANYPRLVNTCSRPDSRSCAAAPSCHNNPIFSDIPLSACSTNLANPPMLADGVVIDLVDTAYMEDLPAWQLPQHRPAAGGLLAGVTPFKLKQLSKVWGPNMGIPPRTCQGGADLPSWQQRIKGAAGRLQDSCSSKFSKVVSCSSSPTVVEEPAYNGPLRPKEEFIALQREASTPHYADDTDAPTWQERLIIMKSTACRLRDNVKQSIVLSCTSSPPVFEEAIYDGPLCTPEEFIELHRHFRFKAQTDNQAIQRMGATHWLHPTAVMLACLYQSLRAGPFQRRGLMKLLQEHMGLIHLVGPFPAEVGSHNMPPITPYLHSEQALMEASQGTLGDVCLPAHLPSGLPAVPKEVVKAARSLYPGLCGQAPTDLPPHGRTQAPYSKPVQDMQVVPQVPQSEPVKDMQEDPPLLVMPAVEQGAVSSYGAEAITEKQQGTARPVINIIANAAFIRASIAPIGLISTSGGADTSVQEESPILCSRPTASQGDEDSIAEIWALTEEDLPIIPQAKQLKLASNPPPVAARPLPEAPTAHRAGPSRPIFAGKSCRRSWASKLTRKLSTCFTTRKVA